MGRKHVYLGRRVPDIGRRGLDSLKEVEGIAKSIISDYKRGRISYRTAMSRMNMLSLVAKKVARSGKARFKWSTVKRVIARFRAQLKKLKKR